MRGRIFVEPVYLRKLIEEDGLSQTELGRELGISGSTISHDLQKSRVAMLTETACKMFWEKKHSKKKCASVIICKAAPDKVEAFVAVAKAMGIEAVDLGEV